MLRNLSPTRYLAAVCCLSLLVAAPSRSQEAAPPTFTPATFEAHVRFLADDLLEGRGIGTRGGQLAAAYIESVFRAAGLAPGFPGGFRQPFAMTAYSPDPAASIEIGTGAAASRLASGDDFVATNFGVPAGELTAEPLFVGYAIDAPDEKWDDYKGVDVRGRLLIAFANEPGQNDPSLFRGKALTIYGRWTTKFKEAARRGAAGMLLVHTDQDAGYSWDVVRNSWMRDSLRLVDDPLVLPIAGWITQQRAREMARAGGLDLDELRRRAEQRSFRPMPLPVRVSIHARQSTRRVEGQNVVGVLAGSGDQAIVINAHFDHLGIGRAVNGDNIYNGAVDNGSALATMLSLAQAYGRTAPSSHPTLVFVGADAEEEGELGAFYYTLHPAVPLARTLAVINFEMSNVWGRTRDVLAIGADHSELEGALNAVLARRGMRITPDPVPEQGYFFRSDQLAYAQAGVPAVWIDGGIDYEGRPAGWGEQVRDRYRATAYHRPSDDVKPEFDYSGLVQLAEIASDLIGEIATRGHIAWKPGSEFQRPPAK